MFRAALVACFCLPATLGGAGELEPDDPCERLVNELILLLERGSASDRACAAVALTELGPRAAAAVSALVEAIKVKDPSPRGRQGNYVEALGRIGPAAEKAIPTLVARLAELDDQGAEEALGQIGPAAVPALIKVLKSGNGNAQIRAMKALGQIGSAGEAAVPELVEALKTEPYRRFAAKPLGRIGRRPDLAVPALRAALNDEEFPNSIGQ